MSIIKEVERQFEIIKRGAVDIIDESEFKEKIKFSLENNKPLRIKQGFDPTAPDLHLGHTVTIRKLKQFQDLGHHILFLIGDYTAMIGDPTGKSETRKKLSKEQVLENAKTYQQQVFKILDPEKTEIVFNSTWFSKMGFEDILSLVSRYTVAQMLERDDFTKRYNNQTPISLVEFIYPLMQGYDSVALKSDVEIGGTDQKFNLLVGRFLQKDYGQKQQCVLTMPILEGLDGVQKMSKSLGNYIGISDSPRDMLGKTMSIPDEMIEKYFLLLTGCDMADIRKRVKDAIEGKSNPRDIKMELANQIVTQYYDATVGKTAVEEFERIFQKGGLPDDMPEIVVSEKEINILDLVVVTKNAESKGEAKRLVKQGGVSYNDRKVDTVDAVITIEDGGILRVGKKRFSKTLLP